MGMDLHDGVLDSYSEHGFPHMFPMLFHVFCRKKSRKWDMCKWPAAFSIPMEGATKSSRHVRIRVGVGKLEPHPMVGSGGK